MLKPNKGALIIAILLGTTTAYAAKISPETPPVVGFKPVYKLAPGKKPIPMGDLVPGGWMFFDVKQLDYQDKDGDPHDPKKAEQKLFIGGQQIGGITQPGIKIPSDERLVGKEIRVEITPVSTSGDPIKGDPLVLTGKDLVTAGAGGPASGSGLIFDPKPQIDNLTLSLPGGVKVGAVMEATYDFIPGEGDPTDRSVYQYSRANEPLLSFPGTVTTSGKVPPYTITQADAGQVMMIYVRAENGKKYSGNWIGVATDGTVKNNGKGSGALVLTKNKEPQSVTIAFKSTANVADNGDAGTRPVARIDKLTASFTPAAGSSSDINDYTFRWLADGTTVVPATQGGNTFTPGTEHQGKAISVEVLPVP